MPKKQPTVSTSLDLSALSSAVNALKANQDKPPVPTPPSGDAQWFGSPIQDLEVGSAMTPKAKTPKAKKDPMAAARERIEKATQDALKHVQQQVNRKLLQNALRERVRALVNAQFHDQLSPADIDRYSQDAARNAAYHLGDLEVIPEEFKVQVVVPDVSAKEKTFTEEPTNEIEPTE